AGNQLALLSIGAFSEASSQELKPLAGLLLKNLVEIEVARPRKEMWESMGALSLNRIFADLKRREQRARFFTNNYGIKPEDIDSAEKLAGILRRSRMKMRTALPIYFNSLPTVIDNKVLKISLDFWHNFIGNDWFELNTLVHPFHPLNRQLAFIMPTE
ncbi:hypothetical protein AMJ44_10165, partial [candidate division WOR-1 bacterium DG_54_3]